MQIGTDFSYVITLTIILTLAYYVIRRRWIWYAYSYRHEWVIDIDDDDVVAPMAVLFIHGRYVTCMTSHNDTVWWLLQFSRWRSSPSRAIIIIADISSCSVQRWYHCTVALCCTPCIRKKCPILCLLQLEKAITNIPSFWHAISQ